MSDSAGQRALSDYLRKDAPAREASVARFMSVAGFITCLVSIGLGPLIGWTLSVLLAAVLGVVTLFFFPQDRALRRGWYRPGLRWVNVAVEVSVPSLLFIADSTLHSVEYALTAPPLAIWATLVALSGFRGSRSLAVGAGAIAALEYALLYGLVAWPKLPPGTLVTLQPALFAVRVLLLFASGVVTALFVGHFNRRAAEALTAVRERDVLGKYLLHERIGAGGMAEVFKATYSPEGGFEKTVALKKILPSYGADREFLTLFRLEAELCSRLNHPNNPPNVLLSTLGEVKVADFGIARAASRAELTQAGVIKGKQGYLAPEQAAGEGLDGRVDLFALGVTLHEALTGRRLFPSGDDAAAVNAVFLMPIPRPSQLRPEVPAELEAVVMGLLERELDARTQTARVALERCLAITQDASAYPSGQRQLSEAVRHAAKEWPELARRAQAAIMAQVETTFVGEGQPGG